MPLPVIGIPAMREEGEILPRYQTTGDYVRQVQQAGGLPVLLPLAPGLARRQLAAWVALCDGVLLPGGGDLDPALYGQPPLACPACAAPPAAVQHRAQQDLLAFIRLAAAAGKPMLGICLGAQALNVAFGGTLVQDIPAQLPGAAAHRQPPRQRRQVSHTVALAPGSLAAAASGCTALWANSYHHQAVERPAPGFVVTGRAPDGVVEAIEAPTRRLLGVQWHPENLAAAGRPEALALFAWLVTEAAGG